MMSSPRCEAFLRSECLLPARQASRMGNMAMDPGIGFGKTVEHNLTLLRELPRLAVGSCPLVLGVSRKSFLARVAAVDTMPDRLWPTVALTALLREKGARVLRVHDVGPNVAALRTAEALLGIV